MRKEPAHRVPAPEYDPRKVAERLEEIALNLEFMQLRILELIEKNKDKK